MEYTECDGTSIEIANVVRKQLTPPETYLIKGGTAYDTYVEFACDTPVPALQIIRLPSDKIQEWKNAKKHGEYVRNLSLIPFIILEALDLVLFGLYLNMLVVGAVGTFVLLALYMGWIWLNGRSTNKRLQEMLGPKWRYVSPDRITTPDLTGYEARSGYATHLLLPPGVMEV